MIDSQFGLNGDQKSVFVEKWLYWIGEIHIIQDDPNDKYLS